MSVIAADIKLSNKKIDAIANDAEKAAKAINLLYVQDSQSGITRRKQGGKFNYYVGKKLLRDKKVLDRIAKLVIPPAWENVWICNKDNGHLQATGIDAKKRKQYRYHSLWNSLRNQTKFYRLYEFGKAVPHIREQLNKDLSLPGLPVEKVLALAVCLMDQTSMRVGNSAYEKLYGSFGLTTLKNRHVKIAGNKMQFIFKGKKGVSQSVSITDKRLARIVKQCREIPGMELFQYYADDGSHKGIDSGMVNSYIKNIAGQDFTAKDFRTWSGTVHALGEFKDLLTENNERVDEDNKPDTKKNIIAVIDLVAAHLGNTRAVCRKYYIHPIVFDLYEKSSLQKYFAKLKSTSTNKNAVGLSAEEKLLLTILKKECLLC